MTEPLTRPVFDNRLLRASGGPDLAVGLGTTLGAVFESPTMGTLVATEFDRSSARIDARNETFNEDEQNAFRELERERQREVSELSSQLPYLVDGEERDTALARLAEIQQERQADVDSRTQQQVDEGALQPPDALAEKYGDLGLQFDRPMSEDEAKILADNKRAEIIRDALIQQGPRGVLPTAAKFGVGLAAMATDPLEVASTFIPVVGQTSKAAALARFGGIGGRAFVGAVEGGVGAALTEPLFYALSRSQQLDYDMGDSLFNIGLGVVFGGGIGSVAGMLSRTTADAPAMREAGFTPERLEVGEVPGFRGIDAGSPRQTASVALSQFINDQPLDVSVLTRAPVRRPQTLSEFVAAAGGINDRSEMFRGELGHAGIPQAAVRGGVSNPQSRMDLDDMAELAAEAGFIPARDTDELVARLREEREGAFTFAERDQAAAEEWRSFYEAKVDAERELARQQEIRSDLEALGIRDVADNEIAAVSRLMATEGYSADEAFERVAIQAEEARAEFLARQAGDPDLDQVADLETELPEPLPDDFIEADTDDLSAMVAQLDLTPEQQRSLDELAEIEERAETYAEVAEAGAVCLGRAA